VKIEHASFAPAPIRQTLAVAVGPNLLPVAKHMLTGMNRILCLEADSELVLEGMDVRRYISHLDRGRRRGGP
jgi:hypothetical protein